MASKRAGAGKDPPESQGGGEKFTFFFGSASPFSQWHPAVFSVDDTEFCCAEQFMMYQKAGE